MCTRTTSLYCNTRNSDMLKPRASGVRVSEKKREALAPTVEREKEKERERGRASERETERERERNRDKKNAREAPAPTEDGGLGSGCLSDPC